MAHYRLVNQRTEVMPPGHYTDPIEFHQKRLGESLPSYRRLHRLDLDYTALINEVTKRSPSLSQDKQIRAKKWIAKVGTARQIGQTLLS